jgi:serine/threonine protein kinase
MSTVFFLSTPLYRDIKTANVLVDEEWRGKLCDFSFACNEECFSKKDFIYGTEEFMSPEISLALDFDRSSDIFSYGITLCEAITFREPSAEFLCRKAQNIFALDEEELADAIIEGCPEELEALACQCCDVDTSKRPTIQTCIEELEALLHTMGGEYFEYKPDTLSKGQKGTSLVMDQSPLCLSALNSNLHRLLLYMPDP